MPYCPRFAVRDGLCQVHNTERDQRRGTPERRGYGREWRAFATAWLQEFPWCGQRVDGHLHAEHSRCVQQGQRVRADVVDHVVPLAKGGGHCSRRNAQSLCGACNRRKAIAEEGMLHAIR